MISQLYTQYIPKEHRKSYTIYQKEHC